LKQQAQSVTSIDEAPEAERRRRMIKYTIAMTIRVACIVLAMVVQGWLMWLFFAGAIFLPYFAVVIANATGSHSAKPVTRAVAPTLTITADAFKSTAHKQDGNN